MPFFFLRVDPAGNVSKRFAGAGFPFARYGGSCPRWVVHTAFAHAGDAARAGGASCRTAATFLCFARTVTGAAARFGRAAAGACHRDGLRRSTRAAEIGYADGLDLERAAVGIGLSCRLCDRPDCRSRAFPPLEHRLSLDPHTASASPFRFEVRRAG